MRRRSAYAMGLALATAMCWGWNFPITKVGVDEVAPFTFAVLRGVVGVTALVCVASSLRKPLWPTGRDMGLVVVVAASMAISQLGLILGVGRIDASLAAVIVSSMPVFAVGLGWAMLGERLSGRGMMGVCVAMAGLVLACGLITGGAGQGGGVGILIMLLAPLFWAVTNTVLARWGVRLAPHVVVTWMMLLGTVMIMPIAMVAEDASLGSISLAGWGSIVYSALFGVAVGFGLQMLLLRRTGAIQTSLTAYLVPVVAMIASVGVFHERVDAVRIFGAVVVVGGVCMTASNVARVGVAGQKGGLHD